MSHPTGSSRVPGWGELILSVPPCVRAGLSKPSTSQGCGEAGELSLAKKEMQKQKGAWQPAQSIQAGQGCPGSSSSSASTWAPPFQPSQHGAEAQVCPSFPIPSFVNRNVLPRASISCRSKNKGTSACEEQPEEQRIFWTLLLVGEACADSWGICFHYGEKGCLQTLS